MTSKALSIWSRTLELLDSAGIASQFLESGFKCSGARIVSGKETIARIGFDSIESSYPFALMLPQSETERLLESHLRKLGVEVERQVELIGIREAQDDVLATLQAVNGRLETVETEWLVGCDGAHSTTRHLLGMPFEGSTQPSDWAIADVAIEGLAEPDKLSIFWHANGIIAVFPITPSRFRVIADLGRATGDGHRSEPTLEEMQSLLDLRGPGGAVLSNPVWLTAFRINERKIRNYSHGRVFLAGDAAHVHSPAGGQGMNTGMQDAFNLAWKLAMVARGDCKPWLLDSYSIERSAVGDVVLRNASRLTDIAVLRNPIAQALRNKIAHLALEHPTIQHRIAQTLAEVEIAYPRSPLTVAASGAEDIKGAPLAGERWASCVGVKPIGARDIPGFTLIGDPIVAEGIAAQNPKMIVATGAGRSDEHVWLIRPDGYVGLTSKASDLQSIHQYLARIAA
jgi:2-polyprenyl-6-methoxyphenol hydroxylase-like FAD-dependent oxidoreductase